MNDDAAKTLHIRTSNRKTAEEELQAAKKKRDADAIVMCETVLADCIAKEKSAMEAYWVAERERNAETDDPFDLIIDELGDFSDTVRGSVK